VNEHMAARRTIKMGLGAVATGTLITIAGLAGAPAGASTGDPAPASYEGNLDCADLGLPHEFKIDAQPSNGVYGPITITNVELVDGRLEFDWSSASAWDAVLVKQADGGLVYEYVPERASDEDVQTVAGQNSGGISHVTFCADDDTPPTTVPETTTTVPETTTTAAEVPTTEAQVLGIVVTRPAPKVLGAQTLPVTGLDSVPLAAAGVGLVLLGGAGMLISARRMRLS
jgi:LPXTG-motif cell wall-anchored protein